MEEVEDLEAKGGEGEYPRTNEEPDIRRGIICHA